MIRLFDSYVPRWLNQGCASLLSSSNIYYSLASNVCKSDTSGRGFKVPLAVMHHILWSFIIFFVFAFVFCCFCFVLFCFLFSHQVLCNLNFCRYEQIMIQRGYSAMRSATWYCMHNYAPIKPVVLQCSPNNCCVPRSGVHIHSCAGCIVYYTLDVLQCTIHVIIIIATFSLWNEMSYADAWKGG